MIDLKFPIIWSTEKKQTFSRLSHILNNLYIQQNVVRNLLSSNMAESICHFVDLSSAVVPVVVVSIVISSKPRAHNGWEVFCNIL